MFQNLLVYLFHITFASYIVYKMEKINEENV